MLNKVINEILFDYNQLSPEEIERRCQEIPNKLLRWLGANHPDNRIRKIFFRLTNIRIGEGTVINNNFVVSDDYEPLLEIGNRVAISPNVTVICASNPNNSNLSVVPYVAETLTTSKKVVIEDDVWIGTQAVLLPGVTIGKMSVVGAGSVVARDVPPFSVVAGVPAKIIRRLDEN